jgi:hypothetical protein
MTSRYDYTQHLSFANNYALQNFYNRTDLENWQKDALTNAFTHTYVSAMMTRDVSFLEAETLGNLR